MRKVLVVGSVNTDLIIYSSKIPKPGETVLGGEFLKKMGGKGANQAVASSRMNAPTYLYANIGDDLFGKEQLKNFEKEGIDCRFISKDKNNSTGIALINVDETGQNSITVAPGANSNHKLNREKEILENFNQEDIFICQLEIPLDTILKLKSISDKIGNKFILNPAPALAIPDSIYSNLFMITPNEFEASLLTNIAYSNQDSIKKMGEWFIQKGVQEVIITLGSAGVFWMNKNNAQFFSVKQVEAIDTTAAGDCFNGCLAAFLSQNEEMEAAIKKSIIAASISVTRKGAQESMPYSSELN